MKKDYSEELIAILKKVGAFFSDRHFVYTSRKHGSVYINKDALYPHTEEVSKVGKMFADKFKDMDIEVVVGPALGGIVLSQWTAHHLTKMKAKQIFGVYTEKTPEIQQVLKRGYDKFVKGHNILVVEDITTTGGSLKKVVDCVNNAEGNIIATCSMVNRDPINVTAEMLGAPFSSLATFNFPAYDEKMCPFCKDGMPIDTSLGYGKQYLAEKMQSS